MESDGGKSHSVNCVDDVLGHCEDCPAVDKAPDVPIAASSTASMFNEKVQVDLLFLGDSIALRDMDMYFKYSLMLPVHFESNQDVWDAFCGGWLGTFGPPKCIQMDEGGAWKGGIWTDLRAARCIKLRVRGASFHP